MDVLEESRGNLRFLGWMGEPHVGSPGDSFPFENWPTTLCDHRTLQPERQASLSSTSIINFQEQSRTLRTSHTKEK